MNVHMYVLQKEDKIRIFEALTCSVHVKVTNRIEINM